MSENTTLRAKRPCGKAPLCKELVEHGKRFCPAHEDCARQYDKDRAGDPFRKLYNTVRWTYLRNSVLARDRICRDCKAWASEEVDHVIPARRWVAQHDGDMNTFFDSLNLQGLCKPCHSRKSARGE